MNAPDLFASAEIVAELRTEIIGRELMYLPEVDSTNTWIRELAETGAQEGTVAVADQQTAGRGRLGRRWESPAGVNLYCSVLLRPDIPVQQAPQLTFLSAVAVSDTLKELYGLQVEVKWPNDILVRGAKIAGLLNEMSAETERIHFVVLGLGINLNMNPDQFPAGISYPATSVALETGHAIDRRRFLKALLQRLDGCYLEFLEKGFGPIRRRWESLCSVMNQSVTVNQGQAREFAGTVVGLDPDGALRLQTPDGCIERILAGEVRVRTG